MEYGVSGDSQDAGQPGIKLAAQISCALALPGHYLHKLSRSTLFLPPDPTAELVRRNNAAGRVRPETNVFMTGLSDIAFDALTARFAGPLKPLIGAFRQRRKSSGSAIRHGSKSPPLSWGKDHIGIGLLKGPAGTAQDRLHR